MKIAFLAALLLGIGSAAGAQEAPPAREASAPLTLRKCLEIGLEQNYDVRIVRNEERVSDNNATAGNAGMLPTVDLSAGYTGTLDNDRTVTPRNGDATTETGVYDQTANVGLAVNWTLFDGLRIRTNYKRLKEMQVPVVLLGQVLPGYSCVYHDDYHAAKEMTERLAKHAGTLGYIGVTQRDVAAGKERRRGFQAGAGDRVRTCAVEGDFSMDAGYEGCKKLLDQEPGLDGIFCATDSIAVGAKMCLEDAGKRVPEDVALAGVGDSMIAKVTRPSIATVHFYYKTSGMEAARLLFDRIQNPGEAVREVKMGYEIVEGGSLR
jgi:hypothetical protein